MHHAPLEPIEIQSLPSRRWYDRGASMSPEEFQRLRREGNGGRERERPPSLDAQPPGAFRQLTIHALP